MNKQDLVEALSTRLQKSQREAAETIDALVDEIKKALSKGEAIRISGFGAFEQTVRSARQGRNPRTGEPVKIGATRAVRFRPAADFKAIVAGTRKAVADAMPGGGGEDAAPAEGAPAKKATAAKRTTAAKKATTAKKATPAKKATTAKKTTPAAKTTTAAKTAAAKTSSATKTTAAPAKKSTPATKAAPAKRSAAKRAPAKKAAEQPQAAGEQPQAAAESSD